MAQSVLPIIYSKIENYGSLHVLRSFGWENFVGVINALVSFSDFFYILYQESMFINRFFYTAAILVS